MKMAHKNGHTMTEQDWLVLKDAPTVAEYPELGTHGLPLESFRLRVRRWPGGNRVRIEWNGRLGDGPWGEWLWAADASIDREGWLTLYAWNYAPTGDARAAPRVLGLAQAKLADLPQPGDPPRVPKGSAG
jgi:hypothetical protein